MTRTEIVAQLNAEISRLERARDFLAAAIKNARVVTPKQMLSAKPAKPNGTVRAAKQKPVVEPAPVVSAPPVTAEAAPALQSPGPQIHRVPPRRRLERRQSQTEKAPSAALRGSLPTGPVAVSANEARKMQDRVAQPAPAQPAVTMSNDSTGERSLGSLIQAFERRAGIGRIEIP